MDTDACIYKIIECQAFALQHHTYHTIALLSALTLQEIQITCTHPARYIDSCCIQANEQMNTHVFHVLTYPSSGTKSGHSIDYMYVCVLSPQRKFISVACALCNNPMDGEVFRMNMSNVGSLLEAATMRID